jgi:hypothetical protein
MLNMGLSLLSAAEQQTLLARLQESLLPLYTWIKIHQMLCLLLKPQNGCNGRWGTPGVEQIVSTVATFNIRQTTGLHAVDDANLATFSVRTETSYHQYQTTLLEVSVGGVGHADSPD